MSQGLQKFIQEKCGAKLYRLTDHAAKERLADGLTVEDIERALSVAEVIEDYPEDRRGHSCLALGWCLSGPVHIVIGGLDVEENEELVIITVYRPEPSHWERDWRTRR